jgi:hypothetical protein
MQFKTTVTGRMSGSIFSMNPIHPKTAAFYRQPK